MDLYLFLCQNLFLVQKPDKGLDEFTFQALLEFDEFGVRLRKLPYNKSYFDGITTLISLSTFFILTK